MQKKVLINIKMNRDTKSKTFNERKKGKSVEMAKR